MKELVKFSDDLISLISQISSLLLTLLISFNWKSLLTSATTSSVNSAAEIDPTLIKNKIAKINAIFKFL